MDISTHPGGRVAETSKLIRGWERRSRHPGGGWRPQEPIVILGVMPSDPSSTTALAPSLDGRSFVMISSSNSAVDPSSPSRFSYFERDGVVWGEYVGDTVTFGRFVGTRVGDELSISFAHVMTADGSVVTGTSGSRVETAADGLRLVESFEVDGVEHVSVCVEMPRGA
jgi:hypothetical protein